MPIIETENLILHTFTKEMMKAILHHQPEKLPFKQAKDWPLPVYLELFPYKIDRFTVKPEEESWEWIIVHKKDKVIIGDIGFKGGPNEKGEIDIGYSIVPEYRGKGYATESGKALVQWGLSQQNVKKVTATCNPHNFASKRVLEKIGLHVVLETTESIYWSS